MSHSNPCLRCGACCAAYRASLNNQEADNVLGGVMPSHLIIRLNETLCAMRGTEKRPIRCHALSGEIGHSVQCSIYDRQPANCRKFRAVRENNAFNSLCNRARSIYGLMPLSSF